MKRTIIQSVAENTELYGLPVDISSAKAIDWFGRTMTSENAGIINGHVIEQPQIIL